MEQGDTLSRRDSSEVLKSLSRLSPHRTHESNWLKQALCALGLHRWYRVSVPDGAETREARFCRWCPKSELLN